ncbi:MAG: thioredoxin domain-containing protein [Pseudomonas sp.]
MSATIIHLTPDDFDAELRRGGTLLLDCWANWCAPCRALSPLLDTLAIEYAGTLRIAKLDTEAHRELAECLGVRSLPLLILFKDGEEQTRSGGLKGLPELRQWLGRHGVRASAPATAASADAPPSLGGAFYGDAELKDFLVGRLRRHAAAGDLTFSRFPYWHEGKGTVSAALVHSQHGRVFERVSGLPVSLACALHFSGIAGEDEVEQVLGAIRPGSEVDGVAPAFFAAWLEDDSIDWPQLLEHDPSVVELRQRWLRLYRAEAAGEAVPPAHWHALREVVKPLRDPRDPRRDIQRAFADMIARLSPPPEPDDEGGWSGALLLLGIYLKLAILQLDQGWTGEQIATEASWPPIEQRARRDADGSYDEERLRQLRRQWESENADWLCLRALFHAHIDALQAPRNARLRERLAGLLSAAPAAA